MLSLSIIVSLITGYFLIRDSNLFLIQKINIVNASVLDPKIQAKVADSLVSYQNKSILSVSTADISESIKKDVREVKDVYSVKKLNGEIDVEIVLKEPSMVFVSFDGYYLLDSENSTIESNFEHKLALNEFELAVLANTADFNAAEVRQKYLDSLPAEEKVKKFDWVKVDEKLKKETLALIKKDTEQKITDFKNAVKASIKDVYEVPVVFVLKNITEKESLIDELAKKATFSRTVIDGLVKNNLAIAELEWESDFTVRAVLGDNTKFIFLKNTTIQKQLSDLETLIWNKKLKAGKTYDLRIGVISVY